MKITEIVIFIGLLWLIELINSGMSQQLSQWGVVPRTEAGLPGILIWTFLHGSFNHLMANTIPLAILSWFVLLRGLKQFVFVTFAITIIAGILLWLFARPAIHEGASGLIFGYFGFLVAMGWYERSFKSWFFSILTLFIYGGIIWGVLPQHGHISWEGHLFGLISGWFIASRTVKANGKLKALNL